jgi:hypothetical protein
MPDFKMVVCDSCLERGPDAMPQHELKTVCPDCVEQDIGPIDWTRADGYAVARQ